MMIKIVLAGVGLLMFIFCSINLSQAAMDTRATIQDPTYPISAPNEHPWQYDDSPGYRDSSLYNVLSLVVTLPMCQTIKAIIFIRTPGVPPAQAKGLQRATIFSRRNEQHSNGER
jgi:hypothetical protein